MLPEDFRAGKPVHSFISYMSGETKIMWKEICWKKYSHICLILTSLEGTCTKRFSETDVVIVIGYINLLICKSVEVFLKRQFSLVKSVRIQYFLKYIKIINKTKSTSIKHCLCTRKIRSCMLLPLRLGNSFWP